MPSFSAAITTKITTHKPPRILITVDNKSHTGVYDSRITQKENHLVSARRFIGEYIPSEVVDSINSAYLCIEDNLMVHLVCINTDNIPPGVHLELITNPE